jgi:hypothetical protein
MNERSHGDSPDREGQDTPWQPTGARSVSVSCLGSPLQATSSPPLLLSVVSSSPTPARVPCLSCQPNQGPTVFLTGSGGRPWHLGLGGPLINSWRPCLQNLSSLKAKQKQTTRARGTADNESHCGWLPYTLSSSLYIRELLLVLVAPAQMCVLQSLP